MKIARIGAVGSEKPVVVEGDQAIDVSSIVSDWKHTTRIVAMLDTCYYFHNDDTRKRVYLDKCRFGYIYRSALRRNIGIAVNRKLIY
jgi:hypothetical protein